MKKLVCVKDIEKANKEGKKVVEIDLDTIVTPLAKDTAKLYGIEITTVSKTIKVEDYPKEDVDLDMIFKVFKSIMDKGLLPEILNLLSNRPYVAETDCTGFKLIRGNTVKFKKLDSSNENTKIVYQELTSSKDSMVKTGLLNIENTNYNWEIEYEQVFYVIEGKLTININEKTYTVYPGDILNIPSGSEINLASSDKARLFYSTYLYK